MLIDFPIIPLDCERRARSLGLLRMSIPWGLIAPHEEQAQRNHGQSLKLLAERGGLSANEALAVIEDRKWAPLHPAEARARLETIVAAWVAP